MPSHRLESGYQCAGTCTIYLLDSIAATSGYGSPRKNGSYFQALSSLHHLHVKVFKHPRIRCQLLTAVLLDLNAVHSWLSTHLEQQQGAPDASSC